MLIDLFRSLLNQSIEWRHERAGAFAFGAMRKEGEIESKREATVCKKHKRRERVVRHDAAQRSPLPR